MGTDDGGFFSFATIALAFWLLIFLGAGGVFIYLFVTKMDQDTKAKMENETKPEDQT